MVLERNEMRLRFYIAKLEKKLIEEYQVQREIQQLELKKKLADLYRNDKEGYERALKFSGLYIEPEERHVIHQHPLTSKL
jgi:hypothetical protein